MSSHQEDHQKKLADAKARVLAMQDAKNKGKAMEPIPMPPPAPQPQMQVQQAAKVAKPTPFKPSLEPQFHTYYSRVIGSKFVFADGSVAHFTAMFIPKFNMAMGVYKTPNPAKAKELDGALGQIFFK